MKRRKAISALLLGMSGAILAPGILLSGCKSDAIKKDFLTEDDISILDEIGETIIPTSPSSPGAKAAKIGAFMKVYVTDCYTTKDQGVFIDGITKLNALSEQKYGNGFVKLSPAQKHELIVALDQEASAYDKNKKKGEPDHYFSMMKDITLFGYFTSEVGATKSLRYVKVPGSYNGNLPYKEGDKAWAT